MSRSSAANAFLEEIFLNLIRLSPDACLVGGFLRDLLMGFPHPRDADIAVPEDGPALARALAERMNAAYVPLDDVSRTARVVFKDSGIVIDIASLKGDSLELDLVRRDFTINASAVRLGDYLVSGLDRLFDPLNARKDIEERIIRQCSPDSFPDDPLRVLRAFRFRALPGFGIEPETADALRRFGPELSRVSPERIRDELFQILAANSCASVLREMDDAGLLHVLFPECDPMRSCRQNFYHHLDVWNHSLESIHALEVLLDRPIGTWGALGEEITAYLDEEPVLGRPRKALLKFAALFHDAGKPRAATEDPDGRTRFFGHERISADLVRAAGVGLKLSGREIDLLSDWVSGHMRPMVLTREGVTHRALFRLRRDFGRDLLGLLMLFLGDLGACRGPSRKPGDQEFAEQRVREVLADMLLEKKQPERPLIDGHDLMAAFGLAPGPLIGKILEELGELRGIGEIETREDALKAAASIIEARRRKSGQRNP